MSARLLWCVCVVVLAGLAGCSGLVSQAGDTPTATPAPVPSASPASTPSQALAPGVTGRGIENLSALKAAHGSLLANTSYTATITETRHFANGTLLLGHTITRRVALAGARFHTIITADGPARTDSGVQNLTRYEAYKEGTDLYLLEQNATDTHYRHLTTTHDGSNGRVFRLLAGLETRVTGRA